MKNKFDNGGAPKQTTKNYIVLLKDDPEIVIDNVHSIERDDEEIVFIGENSEFLAVVNKGEYRAVVLMKFE